MDDGSSIAQSEGGEPNKSRADKMFPWLLAILGAVGVSVALAVDNPDPIDLQVYRSGGTMLLNGDDLYLARDGLPFTYTPFAALLFVPLALIPWPLSVMLGKMVTRAVTSSFGVLNLKNS